MTGLAARLLRHRAGPAAATLLALVAGVMILVAMGTLVESGLRFRAGAPALGRGRRGRRPPHGQPHVQGVRRRHHHEHRRRCPRAALWTRHWCDRIRRLPGVAAVTGDDRVLIGSPAAVGTRLGHVRLHRPYRSPRAPRHGPTTRCGRRPARRGTRRPHRPGRRRGRPVLPGERHRRRPARPRCSSPTRRPPGCPPTRAGSMRSACGWRPAPTTTRSPRGTRDRHRRPAPRPTSATDRGNGRAVGAPGRPGPAGQRRFGLRRVRRPADRLCGGRHHRAVRPAPPP